MLFLYVNVLLMNVLYFKLSMSGVMCMGSCTFWLIHGCFVLFCQMFHLKCCFLMLVDTCLLEGVVMRSKYCIWVAFPTASAAIKCAKLRSLTPLSHAPLCPHQPSPLRRNGPPPAVQCSVVGADALGAMGAVGAVGAVGATSPVLLGRVELGRADLSY